MPYKKIVTLIFLPFFGSLFLLGSTLPHMGRVISNGKPFEGEGSFWFALINDANQTVWNHEGSADIPNQALKISVQNGFYQIGLGDQGIPGMSPLDPSLLLQWPNLKLRIWFDDGINGIHKLGQDQPLEKAPYSIASDHFRDSSIMDSMSARLQFLERENNQSMANKINALGQRMDDLNASGMKKRIDQLESSNSDFFLRLEKIENNQSLSDQIDALSSGLSILNVSDIQILDRLNRLESNQTLNNLLVSIGDQIQELNASKADMIITASITYEMLSPEVAGKLDGNRSLPVLSKEASAKINELQGQLEIALNRIAVLETSQSSGGVSPKILAELGYRQLPDSNLSGVNLSNVDLAGANFSGTNLNGANLYKVNLSSSNLTSADLTASNLEQSNLRGTDLFGSILAGANLKGADFTDANLTGVDLTTTDLEQINLTSADLSMVVMRGIDLSRANLTGTIFNHSDLRGAKLRSTLNASNLNGAILSDTQYSVDLNGSTLDGNFSGFNFSGVDLQNTMLGQSVFFEDVNFTRAQLQGTEVSQGTRTVKFSYSDFSDANLSGAVFYKFTTNNSWPPINDEAKSDFSYAIFHNTDLSKANLQGANLSNADLSKVNFAEANLANTNLTGSLIDLSSIANASSVLGINFTGLDLRTITDLSILDFRGSTWTGANFSGMDFSTGVNLGGTATSVDGHTTTNPYGGFTEFVNGRYTFNVIDFNSVNLSKANLVNLEMSGIILDGADLQNANLSGASLGGVSVSYKTSFGATETTVHKYASLIGANLKGADLSNTNLKGANLTDVDLTGATFSNTIMPDGTIRNN